MPTTLKIIWCIIFVSPFIIAVIIAKLTDKS